MIRLSDSGTYVLNRNNLVKDAGAELPVGGKVYSREELKKNTLTWKILQQHNQSDDMNDLKLIFDSIASHDLTYVNVVQTAKASGLESFPVPYILTNCHNSLCAVGGTLNEDDHRFGLSVAKKYGGIFVPAHQAVIHQYMREMHAACGAMILGSDSHTRYGALGTLAIGEGGGELVKQLLVKTYDIAYPEVIGVHLTGTPRPGIGPQDVALAIIRAVFKNGFVTNKVMEFFGDGIAALSVDFRNGIDVMTTETTCLSSVWETDELVKDYYQCHFRADAYQEMKLPEAVYYDGMIEVDLSLVESMIALPFHPSNAYSIHELYENLEDILYETEQATAKRYEGRNVSLDLRSKIRDGKFYAEQGVIAGCAGGTFENIMTAANIINRQSIGNDEFALSLYPASQPVMLEIAQHDVYADLLKAGVTMRTAFCGPCFGAGDVPANGCLSLRHTTRNFPNREGSKPGQGQLSAVALMDARSIAASACFGGAVTAATDIEYDQSVPEYHFDQTIYQNRVYQGFGKPDASEPLVYGPNIKDWPEFGHLERHLLLKVCSFIEDPVTTTDELIPSGDTATFRSNPEGLAEFTLSRKDPEYVGRAKWVNCMEQQRRKGRPVWEEMEELAEIYGAISGKMNFLPVQLKDIGLGSVIYAIKPGDGSAREQAASCQRVLGGCANISVEYATKRYRSNLVNWGMLPFVMTEEPPFAVEDYIFIPDIRSAVETSQQKIKAYVANKGFAEISLEIGELTDTERKIIMDGGLINFYRNE